MSRIRLSAQVGTVVGLGYLANALMKTLDALRPQPLTSEHYCPRAVTLGGVALLGAGGNAVWGEKGPKPLRE